MEREDDIQLIRRILSGDDTAFETLVQKYQGSVHALAWRKIGDFHIAEEITQDTFLQVYKNLSQLRNPNQLLGWMYVIANRLCLKWLEKNKSVMQSLEDTPVEEIERVSYTHHVAEQRETERTEQHHELVKKLLAKLPESERTVVTLYYLGKMTTKEISKFLGVSVNTITSRLQRARKRLQEQQEALIQEVLGGVQIPTRVIENIMRQVSEINPAPVPAPKPFLPWMALGAAAVLIALFLGASNRYLTRFQKPYSFEAQSEPTIEIIDVPIILDIAAKPAVRSQVGRATTPDKTNSAGTQVSDVTSTSATSENATKFSTAQWSQGNGPPGGPVRNIFATSDGTVYAVIRTGIYRLTADTTAWTRIDTSVPISEAFMPIAEHRGTLYIVAADEIFASDNRGETWRTLGSRPKGEAVELVITDAEREPSSQVPFTMYLALRDNGIFRSTDSGAYWCPLNDGLTAEKIAAMTAVGKTVFAGTENGLYRLDSGVWEKLPLDTSGAVCSLAVSGNNLYAGIGHEVLVRLTRTELQQTDHGNLHFAKKIFHSTDLGASWTEIRLGSKHLRKTSPAGITVLARGKTLLALSYAQSRSTDGGQTWIELEDDQNFFGRSRLPAVMINERTYYKASLWGIHRTTDGGESWHPFMNGVIGTIVMDLVAFNNRLYAHTGYEVYQSTDGGVSWKKLWNHGQEVVINIPTTRISYESKLIPVGDILYSLSSVGDHLSIFRLSTDGDMLIPVQGVPVFDRKKLDYEKYHKSKDREDLHVARLKTETAAASRDTFYVEYRGELFKWKLGDSEWTSTGLVDGSHLPLPFSNFRKGFKLAVLGETVYVGKREGKLFQSLDEGKSWRDLTSNLPLRFTRFNDIVFVDSTCYVATDNGVMVSQTGEQWHVLTDNAGERPIISRFAVDGSKVYGIGDAGGYRLDTHMQWEQIFSGVPDEIKTLAIANGKFYSATDYVKRLKEKGLFYISLEENEEK
ncbi:MAG: sigma-70 family RNA polymerase sigma factor [Candidatus Poribacteria bacterium]|nr:sigma-70 family RNA polymerase sigma factor [Candidatus Poribacteria bacterium]